MQDPSAPSFINVRSPCYFIARTLARCRHCRAMTPMFALLVPPGHETLDLDDEAQDEESAVDVWRVQHQHAFLFHVEFLPASIQSRLKRMTESYRFAGPKMVDSGLANHCVSCDAMQGDHELFCEPEGAFVPTTPAAACAIHLLRVDAPFEAAVGGYADEPAFFDAMSVD